MPSNAMGPYDMLSEAIAREIGVPPELVTNWEATGDGSKQVRLTFTGYATMDIDRFNELVEQNKPVGS